MSLYVVWLYSGRLQSSDTRLNFAKLALKKDTDRKKVGEQRP
jgi:hypothetical protein